MEKSFVNKDILKIEGTAIIEAEKVSLTKEITEKTGTKPTNTTVSSEVLNSTILLADDSGGVLLGVCTDPSLVKPKVSTIIELFDDMTLVAKIDKGILIDACAAKRETDRFAGITYVVPLLDHAVMLDYRFLNRIDAKGDISGLHFYFKK